MKLLKCKIMAKRKLKRSRTDKIFSGVIGGTAEYFRIDPTILRIGWLAALAITGFVPGILVYLIATLVLPNN